MGTDASTVQKETNNLQDIFLDAWKIFEELEETTLHCNSKEFQAEVKKSMGNFEAATRIVSELNMFSSNELVDELSTESLKFLLLPLFLGKLTLKLNKQDRKEVLDVAEIYFKDYLQRCQEYQLCDEFQIDAMEHDVSKESDSSTSEMARLMRDAHLRNAKINQYRRKKEMEEHIKSLKNIVRSETVNDEVKREYFLKLLKKGVIDAAEEIDSLRLEKQMVEMRKMHLSSTGRSTLAAEVYGGGSSSNEQAPQATHVCGHSHAHDRHVCAQSKMKPLQPFIITRNATQKTVFGLGYPSLPVLSVDDFYEQRVKDGVFPDAEKVKIINQEQAIAAARDQNEKEDEEKAILEHQIETDDQENLARMRRMDDYKDEVRRGDGNRHNRS